MGKAKGADEGAAEAERVQARKAERAIHALADEVETALVRLRLLAQRNTRVRLPHGALYEFELGGIVVRNGDVISGARVLHPSLTGTTEGNRVNGCHQAFLADVPRLTEALRSR